MTTKEVKTEILKVIDAVPEDLLKDILTYLKSIQGKSSGTIQLSQHLSEIISEDKELLEKLAK